MGQMLIVYAVTAYIFAMFALYMLGTVKLIQQEGRPPLFFAFLPFAHGYARAVITGQRGRYLRLLTPLSAVCLIIAALLPYLFFLIATSLFYTVTRCFLNYYTFNKKHALLFTILSVLFPHSSGIWIYITYKTKGAHDSL
jgi:hypothetical protein